MTLNIGSFGRCRVFEDFLGIGAPTGGTSAGLPLGGVVQYSTTGAPTIAKVVDEPGGVVGFTTAATNNENVALIAGVFKPADGGCVMEARVKMVTLATKACYVGFSETLATTPVMPAEATGANVLTCNGEGSMVGLLFDTNTTNEKWLAVAGDVAVEETVYETDAPVADYWDVIRVEISADKGDGTVYLNGKLVHTFPAFCTTTDIQHAVVMFENRDAAALEYNVDYMYAEGGRDWTDA